MLKRSVIVCVATLFWAVGLQAKEVTIAMGNFEPYYIEEHNTGIFADIITSTFAHLPDYDVKFIYGYSNQGLWDSFNAGKVDAASNVFDSIDIDGCRSEPVFRFRDVAVTKASKKLVVDSLSGLKGKKIVTFQGAKAFLGDEFSKHVTAAYQEVSKPELQVRMLFADRYDVSVGDVFIFLQAIENLNDESIHASMFEFYDIFPQIYSRLAFHDIQLCQQFNQALLKVKESGEYEKIYQRYLNSLGHD